MILSLAHVANWDAAGAWVVANGMDLTTVAERLKPEGVYQKFLAYRRALGMEILPLTGGDRNTLGVLTDRLRAGAVVPLLADRDFSQARRRGRLLRAEDQDAGGPGDPGAAHRRADVRGQHVVRARSLLGRTGPGADAGAGLGAAERSGSGR